MTTPMAAARADGELRRYGLVVVGRRVAMVIAWLVIVVIVGALAAAVLVPRVAGATPYTILTGSMKPSYPPGTLVVVRPVDPMSIGLGSVITFQLKSGKSEVVTHRVVEVAHSPSGAPLWHTQGDANPVPDPDWVRPVQLKGELWYAVPVLGRANLLLTGSQRHLAVLVIALGLFGFAGSLWFGALRDRLRSNRALEVVS